MAESIIVASGKGGVGKTTLAINLATALAMWGKKVTILDADIEMANVELRLNLGGKKGKSLHDVLARQAEIQEAIYSGPAGLKVVPAGISLEGLRKADPTRLGEVLKKILETTEVLIIDAPAGLSTSLGAMAVAQEMILVVNPEIASVADAIKVKLTFEELNGHVLGAVLNRTTYDKEDLTTGEIETLLETRIICIVPEDREIKKAAAYGDPLVLSTPYSPAAKAISRLAADVIAGKFAPAAARKEDIVSRMLGGLFGR